MCSKNHTNQLVINFNMKKVGNPKSFSKTFFSLALTLVFAFAVNAQEPAAAPAPAADGRALRGERVGRQPAGAGPA